MTIEINGTSGISGVDGSAATPALQGSDTNTGISFGTDEVTINTGGTTAVTVDASQNVGIGTATPSKKLEIAATSAEAGIAVSSSGRTLVMTSHEEGGVSQATKIGTTSNHELRIITNDTERMRITSAGLTEQYYHSRHYNLGWSTANYKYTGLDQNGAYFVYNQANVGVYLAATANSWTSGSDERLKTDLVSIEDGLAKVNSLRAVTGRYLSDEVGVSRSFLIAQDVQQVLPEAVDATDPENLGLAYTDVIPLLVAALKEANERIETLETQNASFEARLAALEGGN